MRSSSAWPARPSRWPRPASALVEIVVTGGNFTPLPIAIPDFASSDPTFGTEIADIVRNNLRRSGLFAAARSGQPADPGRRRHQRARFRRLARHQRRCAGDGRRSSAAGRSIRRCASGIRRRRSRWWARPTPPIRRAIAASPTSSRTRSTSRWPASTGYFDTRVVYVAESGPKANRIKRLAIMDQDGANVQYLTDGKSLALTPRFSPNGEMRHLSSTIEDGNPQVYRARLSAAAPAS